MIKSTTVLELWLVDLEKCAEPLDRLERALPRLTAADRERTDALGNPRERRHRRAAYMALRILLERVAGPGVRDRPIARNPGGKPRLDSGTVEFSLSHIDGLALIGVSPAVPLGVDLERTRPVTMAPHRVAELTAAGAGLGDTPLPSLGSQRAFLQAWARLEAFTKARGRALALTLVDVGVRGRVRPLSPGDIEARARLLARGAGLIVQDLRLPPGLHGAVGAPAGTRFPPVREFPEHDAGIGLLIAS